MEELHRTMMTDLKVGWDSEGRKLSFTRTLFNGAPVPSNITFPSVSSRGVEISWDCDLSRMSEEDKRKVKYVVDVKKGDEEERGWKEVYSGTETKCSAPGLDKGTDYNVRVKCAIGELHGGWSDVVKVKTKKETIDSEVLFCEENGDVFEGKVFEWCGTSDFELLYRGTRDGFGADDFHRTCDNKGKTLVLVKNSSGHVFGGFASIPWTSPSSWEYKQAPGSFIFTLTNMHGIQPTKFPLKNENDGNAVQHQASWGPIFGGGNDFYINPNCNTSNSASGFPTTYNDTTGKGSSIFTSSTSTIHFKVQEIEVFMVNV